MILGDLGAQPTDTAQEKGGESDNLAGVGLVDLTELQGGHP